MAATIPTVEPDFVYQGDTLKFQKTLADYDLSDGWTLTYSFSSDDSLARRFEFTADATGLVSFSTANVEVAAYKGRAKVSKAGETFTVWIGRLDVLPGFATEGDVRTQNKRILDAIDAVIEGRASATILDSTVEGTQLRRIPHKDLMELRDKYALLVAQEQNKESARAGRASRNDIYVKFIKP